METRPKCLHNWCFQFRLEEYLILCLSPLQHHPEKLEESKIRSSYWSFDLPNLANSTMVSFNNEDAGKPSSYSSSRHSIPTIQSNSQAQTVQIPETDGMPFVREFFVNKGFSENLSRSCVPPGEVAQNPNKRDTSKNGFISVLEGKSIQCNFMKWL